MPDRARRSASAIGPLGLEEGRRRQQADAEEPGPAPLAERQPAVPDRHEAVLARRRVKQERDVERTAGDDRRRGGDREPVARCRLRRGTGSRRRPRALGAAVTRTSSIRSVPLASSFSIWSTARIAPGGTGTCAWSTRQSKLPDQSGRSVRYPVARQRAGRASRKKNVAAVAAAAAQARHRTATRPPAPRTARPARPAPAMARDPAWPSSSGGRRVIAREDPAGVLLDDPVGRVGVAQLEVAVDDQVRGRRAPRRGRARSSCRRCRGSRSRRAARPT